MVNIILSWCINNAGALAIAGGALTLLLYVYSKGKTAKEKEITLKEIKANEKADKIISANSLLSRDKLLNWLRNLRSK